MSDFDADSTENSQHSPIDKTHNNNNTNHNSSDNFHLDFEHNKNAVGKSTTNDKNHNSNNNNNNKQHNVNKKPKTSNDKNFATSGHSLDNNFPRHHAPEIESPVMSGVDDDDDDEEKENGPSGTHYNNSNDNNHSKKGRNHFPIVQAPSLDSPAMSEEVAENEQEGEAEENNEEHNQEEGEDEEYNHDENENYQEHIDQEEGEHLLDEEDGESHNGEDGHYYHEDEPQENSEDAHQNHEEEIEDDHNDHQEEENVEHREEEEEEQQHQNPMELVFGRDHLLNQSGDHQEEVTHNEEEAPKQQEETVERQQQQKPAQSKMLAPHRSSSSSSSPSSSSSSQSKSPKNNKNSFAVPIPPPTFESNYNHIQTNDNFSSFSPSASVNNNNNNNNFVANNSKNNNTSTTTSSRAQPSFLAPAPAPSSPESVALAAAYTSRLSVSPPPATNNNNNNTAATAFHFSAYTCFMKANEVLGVKQTFALPPCGDITIDHTDFNRALMLGAETDLSLNAQKERHQERKTTKSGVELAVDDDDEDDDTEKDLETRRSRRQQLLQQQASDVFKISESINRDAIRSKLESFGISEGVFGNTSQFALGRGVVSKDGKQNNTAGANGNNNNNNNFDLAWESTNPHDSSVGPSDPFVAFGENRFGMIQYTPKHGLVNCNLTREKGSLFDPNTYFSLKSEASGKLLLGGRKRGGWKATSNFIVSLDDYDTSKNSVNYVGKVRANAAKTVYNVYGAGQAPPQDAMIHMMKERNEQLASSFSPQKGSSPKPTSPSFPLQNSINNNTQPKPLPAVSPSSAFFGVASVLHQQQQSGQGQEQQQQQRFDQSEASAEREAKLQQFIDKVFDEQREEYCCILYQPNLGGSAGHRKMIVIIPKPADQQPDGKRKVYKAITEDDSILAHWKRDPSQFITLETKSPAWNEKLRAYQLNFHGRVEKQSIKNFQLIDVTNPGRVVLQVGRRDSFDEFACDFRAPLNAFYAMTIALTAFDGSIVRE